MTCKAQFQAACLLDSFAYKAKGPFSRSDIVEATYDVVSQFGNTKGTVYRAFRCLGKAGMFERQADGQWIKVKKIDLNAVAAQFDLNVALKTRIIVETGIPGEL